MPAKPESLLPFGSPPTKKLKQARLPFKVLDTKPPPVGSNRSKKRKSDTTLVQTKASKALKNDDSDHNQISCSSTQHADNEVSSSSEPDSTTTKLRDNSKVSPTLLDKFIRITQQPEVTTSGVNEVIIIEENETDGAEEEKENRDVCEKRHTEVTNTFKIELSQEHSNVDTAVTTAPCQLETTVEQTSKPLQVVNSDVNLSHESNAVDNVETTHEDEENASPTLTEGNRIEHIPESVESTTVTEKCLNSTNDVNTNEGVKTPSRQIPTKDKPRSAKQIEKENQRIEKAKKREEERKQKQAEQELLRLEKLKQREEERRVKEEQRQAEKEKKDQEKAEAKLKKELERKEKIEEKEKLKEEERKKKQELVDAKNEEKRKKEEERQKLEDLKKNKMSKSQNLFKGFFTKTEKDNVPEKEEVQNRGPFQMFNLRADMKLAPISRLSGDICEVKRGNLENFVESGEQVNTIKSADSQQLYLDELQSGCVSIGKSLKTWPYIEDDVVMLDDHGESTAKHWMRAKMLKFKENYRPAYYGTWRKKSSIIKPRAPLNKDTDIFDYEVDSDDDWEEEEPGESLSGSEGEEVEEDDGGDDDGEGFFVPHGYLSDDEINDEEPEELTPEMKKTKQLAKMRAWEEECNKKYTVLQPVCLGVCYSSLMPKDTQPADPIVDKLNCYMGEVLDTEAGPILLGDAHKKWNGNATSNNSDDPATASKKPTKKLSFPEEAMPDLIHLVHGNVLSIQKIITEFREFWYRKTNPTAPDSPTASDSILLSPVETAATDVEMSDGKSSPIQALPTSTPVSGKQSPTNEKTLISKRQLDLKIRSSGVYERHPTAKVKCWCINEKILQQYDLTDLSIPNTWKWITRPQPTPKTDSVRKEIKKEVVVKEPVNVPTKFSITQYTIPQTAAEMSAIAAEKLIKSASKKIEMPSAKLITPKNKCKPGDGGTPQRVTELKGLTPISLFVKAAANKTSVKSQPENGSDCVVIDDNSSLGDSVLSTTEDVNQQKISESKRTGDSEEDCMIID